ncbi:hypothetical protein HAX54_018317 [Datura stramonium]|uniref:Uncharacterized protein n=1 Tax=Datura stramonium TaxID=4076 RepID=A0ABS8UPA6_DATST|nr:hypothetical protein [Datura stramonium]
MVEGLAKSDSEDPPTDDAEEDDNNVEESGEDGSAAEDFGEKESATEESGEHEEDSDPPTTPNAKSKRWTVQGSRDIYYAGLAINDKGNPRRSIQEEPWIRTDALNEVPKLKRLFDIYNMHWMAETPGIYSVEMVHEYYANYYCIWKNSAPSKQGTKKQPVLDSVR